MATAQQRKDKYKAKIDGRILGQRYEDTKKLAVTKQKPVFIRQVEIEEKVKAICEGIPSILLHYYIDFGNEFNKWLQDQERSIIFTKWVSRGLNEDLLDLIGEELFNWVNSPSWVWDETSFWDKDRFW